MNMFEKARAIRGMLSLCSTTQEQIARKMGVSQSYVANKMRLLNLSPEMQERILAAGVSERHARALLRLPCEPLMCEVLDKISAMRLNVSQTEALIDSMLVEDMTARIALPGTRERIEELDRVISTGVKNLASHGIKVKKKTEYYTKMRIVTVCIEEN